MEQEGKIQPLPQEVRSYLRSGVAITSIAQCVEELLLNALDAGARCVAVRLNLSSFKIQIVDNGTGIPEDQLPLVGCRYSTSKCHTVENLENLCYFGYRGEALASIRDACSILEIITRPKYSLKTFCKLFQQGKEHSNAESKIPRPSTGTTVTVYSLFENFPVRRKAINEALELERIRQRVEGLALIRPDVSISLRNDVTGNVILHTHKCSSILVTFSQLFGASKSKSLVSVNFSNGQFTLKGYIGKEGHSKKDYQFIYINSRLVLKTKVHKLLNQLLSKCPLFKRRTDTLTSPPMTKEGQGFSGSPSKNTDKHPVYILDIICPLTVYDITFDPAKTLVEFKDWDVLLSCTTECVNNFLKRENLVTPTETETEEIKQTATSSSETVTCEKDPSTATNYSDISPSNMKDTLFSKAARRCKAPADKTPHNEHEKENNLQSTDDTYATFSQSSPECNKIDRQEKEIHQSTEEVGQEKICGRQGAEGSPVTADSMSFSCDDTEEEESVLMIKKPKQDRVMENIHVDCGNKSKTFTREHAHVAIDEQFDMNPETVTTERRFIAGPGGDNHDNTKHQKTGKQQQQQQHSLPGTSCNVEPSNYAVGQTSAVCKFSLSEYRKSINKPALHVPGQRLDLHTKVREKLSALNDRTSNQTGKTEVSYKMLASSLQKFRKHPKLKSMTTETLSSEGDSLVKQQKPICSDDTDTERTKTATEVNKKDDNLKHPQTGGEHLFQPPRSMSCNQCSRQNQNYDSFTRAAYVPDIGPGCSNTSRVSGVDSGCFPKYTEGIHPTLTRHKEHSCRPPEHYHDKTNLLDAPSVDKDKCDDVEIFDVGITRSTHSVYELNRKRFSTTKPEPTVASKLSRLMHNKWNAFSNKSAKKHEELERLNNPESSGNNNNFNLNISNKEAERAGPSGFPNRLAIDDITERAGPSGFPNRLAIDDITERAGPSGFPNRLAIDDITERAGPSGFPNRLAIDDITERAGPSGFPNRLAIDDITERAGPSGFPNRLAIDDITECASPSGFPNRLAIDDITEYAGPSGFPNRLTIDDITERAGPSGFPNRLAIDDITECAGAGNFKEMVTIPEKDTGFMDFCPVIVNDNVQPSIITHRQTAAEPSDQTIPMIQQRIHHVPVDRDEFHINCEDLASTNYEDLASTNCEDLASTNYEDLASTVCITSSDNPIFLDSAHNSLPVEYVPTNTCDRSVCAIQTSSDCDTHSGSVMKYDLAPLLFKGSSSRLFTQTDAQQNPTLPMDNKSTESCAQVHSSPDLPISMNCTPERKQLDCIVIEDVEMMSETERRAEQPSFDNLQLSRSETDSLIHTSNTEHVSSASKTKDGQLWNIHRQHDVMYSTQPFTPKMDDAVVTGMVETFPPTQGFSPLSNSSVILDSLKDSPSSGSDAKGNETDTGSLGFSPRLDLETPHENHSAARNRVHTDTPSPARPLTAEGSCHTDNSKNVELRNYNTCTTSDSREGKLFMLDIAEKDSQVEVPSCQLGGEKISKLTTECDLSYTKEQSNGADATDVNILVQRKDFSSDMSETSVSLTQLLRSTSLSGQVDSVSTLSSPGRGSVTFSDIFTPSPNLTEIGIEKSSGEYEGHTTQATKSADNDTRESQQTASSVTTHDGRENGDTNTKTKLASIFEEDKEICKIDTSLSSQFSSWDQSFEQQLLQLNSGEESLSDSKTHTKELKTKSEQMKTVDKETEPVVAKESDTKDLSTGSVTSRITRITPGSNISTAIAENSEIEVPSKTTWMKITDPATGCQMYVNTLSGTTMRADQWKGSPPQSPKACSSMSVTPQQQQQRQTLNASVTTSSMSVRDKSLTCATLSPSSVNVLKDMLDQHVTEMEVDTRIKWREKSNQLDSVTDSNDPEDSSVAKLFSDWDNPVFPRSEQEVLTAGVTGVSRSTIKAYRNMYTCQFTKSMLKTIKVIGQIDNKFIACLLNTDSTNQAGAPNMLVVVDQHAAHERVRLEDLTEAAYTSDNTEKGAMLKQYILDQPEQISLPEDIVRIVLTFKEEFSRIGLKINQDLSNKTSVLVLSIPACIVEREINEVKRKRDPVALELVETLIKEHVELLRKTKGAQGRLPNTIHKLLCSKACHGAIKFGDTLTRDQCTDLMDSLSHCDLPFQCAHGRPSVMPILGLDQLATKLPKQKPDVPRLHKITKQLEEQRESHVVAE